MLETKYTNVKPIDDFDWDLYSDGNNGTNLVRNPHIKANRGSVVYCHEPYAQETYKKMCAWFDGSKREPTAKDALPGTLYDVVDIKQVSDHEVMLDTNGGMSAVVDMNKEHQFVEALGCPSTSVFMGQLANPDSKEVILKHARTAKVIGNRVSIWEGVRANTEREFMEQLKDGNQLYGYTARVLSINNGGYTVEIKGLKCFLPNSLAASGPITDFEALIGKTIEVCIVNYSKLTNNFVVSHKKYLELTLPYRVKNELYPGLKVFVKVTGQSKNGLFCAIRDNNGEYPFSSLMHRSTMSPDAESSFDKNEYMNGDQFVAYIHRIDWSDDGKYRIVIGDQIPELEKPEDEEEE